MFPSTDGKKIISVNLAFELTTVNSLLLYDFSSGLI